MNNQESLKQKVNHLPKRPGVYLMQDSLGNIIYVGKAKNLKNRVSQYFRMQKDRDPKVEEMIQHIIDFEYRVLDTELDALLEECRLIKEIKPRYNRQMKNDQKYVFLKIPDEHFPKLEIVQERKEDGALYYGPFNSRHRVEIALQYLNDSFLIRKCSSSGRVKGGQGCLYLHLGTCLGVCTGKVSPEEYKVQLQAVCQAIEGKDKEVLKEAKNQLERAIEELSFERAARYREYILGLHYIQGRQKLLKSTRRNRNLLAFEFLDEGKTTIKLFLIKGNKLLQSKVVDIGMAMLCSNSLAEYRQELGQFLKVAQEKLSAYQGSPRQLTQQEVDEAQILDSYLRRDRVISLRVTQKALVQGDFADTMIERIDEVLLRVKD